LLNHLPVMLIGHRVRRVAVDDVVKIDATDRDEKSERQNRVA